MHCSYPVVLECLRMEILMPGRDPFAGQGCSKGHGSTKERGQKWQLSWTVGGCSHWRWRGKQQEEGGSYGWQCVNGGSGWRKETRDGYHDHGHRAIQTAWRCWFISGCTEHVEVKSFGIWSYHESCSCRLHHWSSQPWYSLRGFSSSLCGGGGAWL